HDALSDVTATIALAWLIKQKQPKLFSYLLSMRDKRKIQQFVQNELTFVYSSGKYPSEFEKTTIVRTLGNHPKSNGVLVYDLRHDPEQYLGLTPEALVEKWKWKKDSDEPRLPVKSLQFNRCPAIAPLGVLDEASTGRLQIDMGVIDKHRQILEKNKEDFYDKLIRALSIMDKNQQTQLVANELLVDEQLYDGFINDRDRRIMQEVRDTKPEELSSKASQFNDSRLKNLMPFYKAL